MNTGKLNSSKVAEIMDGLLTAEQKKIINKDYPYRDERDALIRALRRKGVPIDIIVDLSGLSRTSISRIGLQSDQRNIMMLERILRRYRDLITKLYEASSS